MRKVLLALGAALMVAAAISHYRSSVEVPETPRISRVDVRKVYHVDPQNFCEEILMRMEHGPERHEILEKGGYLSNPVSISAGIIFFYKNGECRPESELPPQHGSIL